jgi:tetratricopeptide (TPR) repeat protein
MTAVGLTSIFTSSSNTTEEKNTTGDNLRKTLAGLTLWTVGNMLWIVVYAVSRVDTGSSHVNNMGIILGVIGYAALLGVAALAVGALLGFLFGIPRTIQSEDKSTDEYRQVVNTNLEQISDWLTKILVGVGLTQLNNLPLKIWALADKLKSGLNDNQAITTCVILNFLVCGFFAGYLLTRLFLAAAFNTADRNELLLAKADRVSQQFTAAGQYKKAIEALEFGLQKITEATPTTQKRDIYERLTYNYLYQDPPRGFTKAIDLGEKYVAEEPATPSAKIWANLALAYGQQYRWESEHDKRESVLNTARDQALDAIKESVKLEPRMRSLFRMVWDPGDPTKISTEENDLEVFYKDRAFADILSDDRTHAP